MKRLFLFLMLILVAVMVQPAQAALYTGEITDVYGSSPFSVSAGDTFNWSATWSGTPDSEGWLSADSLMIPVDPYQYIDLQDADNASGWPKLHFTGGVLDGVNALALDWLVDLGTDPDTYYHFTTNTPLTLVFKDGSWQYDFDYLTFSVFSTPDSINSWYELNSSSTLVRTEVLSGVLYTSPVPIPPSFLLFGTGLIGLAGFRRKVKRDA